MRLALVYLDKGGGICLCAYELARALAGKVDLTCYLASQNPMIDQFEALPCRVKVFPMRRGFKSLLISAIRRRVTCGVVEALVEDQPDIILDAGSQLWIEVIERQLNHRFPIAEMLHDVIPHPGRRYMMYAAYHRLYPSIADAMVSLSEFGGRQIESRYPGKLRIVSRHGVILDGENASSDAMASNRHRLLFFGQITPYKGLDVLVEAFALAKQADPTLELDIVGRGKISEPLMDRIKRLGIGLRNEYISDELARQIILQHGVMVLPYTSATQSGVAAVALANGMPGIATNVGALPEQIVHNVSGLVVPPNDPKALSEAILSISGSYERARAFSEGAVKLAREVYSWDIIADQLLADLKSILKQ